MRKPIFFVIITSVFVNIYPVSHLGLKWEYFNCWMISSVSALIHTQPLREMLKNYEVKISPDDSPDLVKRKEILQEFIKIMNQAFNSDQDPVPTKDLYEKICDLHSFKKGKFNFPVIDKFLEDITIAYPKLQEIFFIPKIDSVYAHACYNNNTLLHRSFNENELGNFRLIISSSEDNPYPMDLIKGIERIDNLGKGKIEFYGKAPKICVENKCGQYDDYQKKGFVAFKKAPRIIIFQNSAPMNGCGIKIPDNFKMPEELFTDPKRVSANKYNLYSIIVTSPGSHFWNYSRDVNSDKWMEYNYSNATECDKPKIERIKTTGFDGSKNKVPNYIFYEMENYDQYSLKIKLIDLQDSLVPLKSKLLELKSKLELFASKVGGVAT